MIRHCLSRAASASCLVLVGCSSVGSPAPSGASMAGDPGLGITAESIVDGQTDRNDPAVLAIALVTSQEEALCSGSLIAPNLVLTARHCVSAVASPRVVCGQSRFGALFEPSELWVSQATQVGRGQFYPALRIEVPSSDSELCGSDIALIVLDGEFSSDAVPPVAPRLDLPVQPGEAFRAVGFGEAQAAGAAGVRRERSGLEVLCGPDDCGDPELVTSREWIGPRGVCDGDSGGPAFDAQGRVVGVASRASDDCDLSIYSAVSSWKDWVLDVADQAYRLGSYSRPAWESDATAASDESATDDDAATTDEPPAPESAPDAGSQPPSGPAVSSAAHHDSGCALAPAPALATASGSALPLLWFATLLAAVRRGQRRRALSPRRSARAGNRSRPAQ